MNDWKAELDAKAQQAQDTAELADPTLMLDHINAQPQWRYIVQRIVDDVVCQTYSVSAFSDAEALRIAAQIGDGESSGRLVIEFKQFEE